MAQSDRPTPGVLNLRQAIEERAPDSSKGSLLGCWLVSGSVSVARAIASTQKLDFIVIDAEHAPTDIRLVDDLIKAIRLSSLGRTAALVRLPSQAVEWIKWALDAGANGIIVPRIDSVQEAKQLVSNARYPPIGDRSFGPFSAPLAIPADAGSTTKGVLEYFIQEAPNVVVLPQIESRGGLEHVDEIIGLEGISGAFVGPVDLRLSLGLSPMPPALDKYEPMWSEAVSRVMDAARKHGKVVGTVTDGSQQMIADSSKLGFRFISTSTDLFAVAETVALTATQARAASV
ncbi:hpaI, hpcH [Ceraceosorus bombacis]|uniref:HpaI, hpcH n=1 Tax=Ceraceosorus bombacis TaxID=401625 RepID=A0A0P1BSK5_9BASI|nr:hpaI, hpcH [Ceraceosorus bombacis]